MCWVSVSSFAVRARPLFPGCGLKSYALPSFLLASLKRYRYAGYDTTYQYYGMTMSDDGFFNGMSPCEIGTDCTDCGVKVRLWAVRRAGRLSHFLLRKVAPFLFVGVVLL